MNLRIARNPLFRSLVLAGLAAACGAALSPAVAGKSEDVDARELLRRGEILPLVRILDIVQRNVPGDIIEIELDRDDDDGASTWEYEVEVLAVDGAVRKLKIDARSGDVLKIEDD
jgi:uncharacterized membrane protein YkoI